MLPAAFLARPIAHRALHGTAGPENSRDAIRAAVEAGYGIEIDLQPSRDGQAMVFHDYDLGRLTGEKGPIRQRDAAALAGLALKGTGDGIPTLPEVLGLVAGRVPLLIELKDQHGSMGETDGTLETATAAALEGYDGPVAVMSFNPHMVARMAGLLPGLPRGLTTCAYPAKDWLTLPRAVRTHLARIPDFDRTGASFVSHQHTDLSSQPVAALKARGVPVLCWTIRTPDQAGTARRVADQITFEGFAA
ncbi:glycerophosphodiester phosphodiesterase family protein [Thetidibacter halocola]|uniref:Phosphodiesterase n=1 Tax=Thetidibacter halocola TaxID=2827239 RepID=A0A8J8B713_9RHOB|nr:glycerophosphodiester phosphodiesterase family protein [Thetidibacter halocola]MBS0124636.1 phosphodiesterase [Thetidibacter halocola]